MHKTSYQQFQPEDRMSIASLRQQGFGVRAIARAIDRSASTVSRELQRNTEHFQVTRDFLANPARMLRILRAR
jgi:IS30 family transposase